MNTANASPAHTGPHRLRSRRRSDAGFTLIELMVALAVFMVGLMGVVSMQLTAANHGQHAGEITLATNLATAKLDDLRVSEFATLADGTRGYTKYGGDDGTYFTVTWTVVGSAALKDVSVTTSWKRHPADSTHNITLNTKLVP